MKAFRFRLESVLGLRRFEDERARLELARAERALAEAGEQHAAWRERVRESADALGRRLAAGLPAGLLRSSAAALETLDSRVAEAADRIGAARAQLAERRRAARLAHARKRALERLRELASAEHRRELERHAQRELDEIGSLRAGRRS